MTIGAPLSRIATARSIFRPHVYSDQLSIAYSPITRKWVFCVNEPVVPPRVVTAFSQSLREPNPNVPLKQKQQMSNVTAGPGDRDAKRCHLSTRLGGQAARDHHYRRGRAGLRDK